MGGHVVYQRAFRCIDQKKKNLNRKREWVETGAREIQVDPSNHLWLAVGTDCGGKQWVLSLSSELV